MWPLCGPNIDGLLAIPIKPLIYWWAREGSNLQPDGYEPSARDALWRELTFLLVVTQIDTQAVPDGARTTAN